MKRQYKLLIIMFVFVYFFLLKRFQYCQWRLKNPQKWRPKIPHPRKSITLSKREVDYARHGGTIYDTPPIE